jgi:hypothetical protein
MLNINNMKNTFLRYQSALFIATAVTTTVVAPSSSQAFELTFSSPNVLSGIKGVSFTSPSSGITRTYNVTLEQGTIFDIYGNPPIFDVNTSIDAEDAMKESAIGIDFYLQNISPDISFFSSGIDIFYIPYSYDSSIELASYWSSGKKFNDDGSPFVNAVQTDLPSDSVIVFAHLQPVPEPSMILGLFTICGIGLGLKKKK